MGFKTKTAETVVKTWEFRVWTPLSQTNTGPTLEVYSFTGTKAEFVSKLGREILDWGEQGAVGPLMSLASVLLDEWKDE